MENKTNTEYKKSWHKYIPAWWILIIISVLITFYIAFMTETLRTGVTQIIGPYGDRSWSNSDSEKLNLANNLSNYTQILSLIILFLSYISFISKDYFYLTKRKKRTQRILNTLIFPIYTAFVIFIYIILISLIKPIFEILIQRLNSGLPPF